MNLTHGEGRNVGKDAVTGESVDESNADQSNVEDAEDQAAVVEKVSYLASWVHFGILIIQGRHSCFHM